MSSERQSYADVVRTQVRVEYADDVIQYNSESSSSADPTSLCNIEEMARTGYLNMSGYFSLDWRSYKTPMIVSFKSFKRSAFQSYIMHFIYSI